MKKLLITAAVVVCTVSSFAQGTLVYNNRVTGQVFSPVYGVEPSDNTISKQGNTVSGTPAGGQTYGGATLAGTGFSAELWAGTQGTAEGSLVAVPSTLTGFRVGGFAGFIVAPLTAVAVPGVPEGSRATVELRAWDNRTGTITTWAQVLGDPTIPRGASSLFDTPALGGLSPAPNMIGLSSFNLYSAVPEPSTIALGVLGAAGLLLFRRRK